MIVLLIFVEWNYQGYLEENQETLAFIEVKDGLSINYPMGKKIVVNDIEKIVTFSVTNHMSEAMSYYININDLEGDRDALTYEVQEENHVYDKKITSLSYTSVANKVTIEPNVTHRYTLVLHNEQKKNVSFRLDIGPFLANNSFSNILLAQNDIKEQPLSSFEGTANEDEGLIKKEEESGTVYYYRGNVANNYVSFANHIWRIVRINADGTVKMILNNVTENMMTVNDTDNKGNTNFETTQVYNFLLDWYDLELKDYDSQIASTTYCYDDSILKEENGVIDYLSNNRLFIDYLPTSTCNGSVLSVKIALLSADEAVLAGANSNENKDYYLYLDGLQAAWWTMTPNKKENDVTSYVVVNLSGALQKDVSEESSLFLRPVVSLNREVKVTGSGTVDDPFVVE